MNRTLNQYLSKYQCILRENKDKTQKVAILRSISCEILTQMITVDMNDSLGKSPNIYFCGFNQYAQEIINTNSDLYIFAPNYTLMLVMIEDICGEVFNNYYNTNDHIEKIDEAVLEYVDLIKTFQQHSKSDIFICNFVIPYLSHYTDYHSQRVDGVFNLVEHANILLTESLLNINGVYILDLHEIIYNMGKISAYNPLLFMLSKNPFNNCVYTDISQRMMRLIATLHGNRKKCIVLDLDNTLWKGIIGEDGMSGIEITEPFKQFQLQLLNWKFTGILLAICSKNNYDDGMAVIREHSEMVLKESDFASIRINWDNKADNLISLAEELNIGTDSMIFIDDSQFECEFVHNLLPDVETLHLDGNIIKYAELIKYLPSLNFIILTNEDLQRSSEYISQKQRVEYKMHFDNIDLYLKSLNITIKVSHVNDLTIARAAQLTQKTNQFNLTTKRYTIEQLRCLINNGYILLSLESSDKFSNNGIVGLAIIKNNENIFSWNIDTYLLSCRILNRNIEFAFFNIIKKLAFINNIQKIIGKYVLSDKNSMACNFYNQLGFYYINDLWVLNVNEKYSNFDYIADLTDLSKL